MAISLNRVTLLGNLGDTPKLMTTANGTVYCHLSIATSRRMKMPNSEEWKDMTEWHRVTLWGRTAETACSYLTKGAKVYVEGELRYSNYEDSNGVKIYRTDIYGNNLILLSSRNSDPSYTQYPAPNSNNNQNSHVVSSTSEAFYENLSANITPDEDVPF
ncbi:MAG: single-stranded DNA-binding protein [Bacteroidetes bacterium]|nr:single-stranded DNA-binding protein [Bacteroidota bacterium]